MTDTAENNTEMVVQRHECLICLENIDDDCYEMACCGEKYCATCLESWRNSADRPTCPKCRSEFSDDAMPPPPPRETPSPSTIVPTVQILNNNEVLIGNEIYVSRSEERDDMFYITDSRDPNNSTVIYINSDDVVGERTRLKMFQTLFWKNCSLIFFTVIIFYILLVS